MAGRAHSDQYGILTHLTHFTAPAVSSEAGRPDNTSALIFAHRTMSRNDCPNAYRKA